MFYLLSDLNNKKTAVGNTAGCKATQPDGLIVSPCPVFTLSETQISLISIKIADKAHKPEKGVFTVAHRRNHILLLTRNRGHCIIEKNPCQEPCPAEKEIFCKKRNPVLVKIGLTNV